MTRKYTVQLSSMLAGMSMAATVTMVSVAHGQASPAAGASERSASAVAVVAVADTLLSTIASHDTVTARRLMARGARLTSISVEGRRLSAQSDSNFLRTVGDVGARYLERMWTPTVTIDGPLAVVSGRYDFHIDGKFSHCGTDVFTLMRGPAGWQVVALAWTTQQTGCDPSPLGPPKR